MRKTMLFLLLAIVLLGFMFLAVSGTSPAYCPPGSGGGGGVPFGAPGDGVTPDQPGSGGGGGVPFG